MSKPMYFEQGVDYDYPLIHDEEYDNSQLLDPCLFPNHGENVGIPGNDNLAYQVMQEGQQQVEGEMPHASGDISATAPGLTFASYDEYSRQVEQQRIDKWNAAIANGGVDDSPKTAPEIQNYIRRIVAAFKNSANIIDKNGKNRSLAQAAQRFRDGYYTDLEIEEIAWEIYDTARKAQVGIRVAGPHNGPKAEKHETFHKRMEAIIHGLLKSKAECKQVLDPLYLNRLCENPTGEFLMKINNGKINGQRDVQNELGRNALNDKLDMQDVATYKEKAKKCREEFIEKTKAVVQMDSAGSLDSTPVRGNRRAAGTISSSTALPRAGAKRKIDASPLAAFGNSQDQSQPVVPEYRPVRRQRVAPHTISNLAGMQEPGAPYWRSFMSGGIAALPPNMVNHQHNVNFGMSGQQSPMNNASSPMGELHLKDKSRREIICDLLRINRFNANRYNLLELRTYARAYNSRLSHAPWFPPNLPDYTGWGHRLEKGGNTVVEHIANAIPRFQEIAMERRDLLHTGFVNTATENLAGFDTQGDEVKDDALGVRTEGGISYDTIFHKVSNPPSPNYGVLNSH